MQQLSQGSLSTIFQQQLGSTNSNLRPVLQCLEIVPTQSEPKRYRLVLSDGTHKFSYCLASSQLTPFLDRGGIQPNYIITLNEYATHETKQRKDGSGRVIVILTIDEQNIQTCGGVIGSPVDLLQGLQSGSIPPENFGQQQATNSANVFTGTGATTGGQFNAGNNNNNNSMGGQFNAGNISGNNSNNMNNQGMGGFNQGGFNQQQLQRQPLQSNTGGGVDYSGGAGAIATNSAVRIIPISYISPYMNKLVIKGRVTSKSDKRLYNNAKGDGQLFSFEIVDSTSDLKVSAFNAECEKFFDLVQVGNIYQISKGNLKPKNARYNATSHSFELMLGRDSEIVQVQDDQQIPSVRFNFKQIKCIESMEVGTVLDIIGVVDTCQAVQEITKKDGTPLQKRSIVVKDDSQRSIEVTLWGKYSTDPGNNIEQMLGEAAGNAVILAVKSCRVGDFNGKNLSTVSTSSVLLNPDVPQANKLRTWFASGGGDSGAIQSLSSINSMGGGRQDRRVTVKVIQDESMGSDSNKVWVVVRAYVTNVLSNMLTYPACPLQFNGRECNKKLSDESGAWNCGRCLSDVPQPHYRWMMSLGLKDETGDLQPVQVFGDVGDALVGMTANEYQAKLADKTVEEEEIVSGLLFKEMMFKLKIFQDTYNDENRIKYMTQSIEAISLDSEEQFLDKMMQSLTQGEIIMAPPTQTNTNRNNNAAAGNSFAGNMGGFGGGNRFAGNNNNMGFGAGNNIAGNNANNNNNNMGFVNKFL